MLNPALAKLLTCHKELNLSVAEINQSSDVKERVRTRVGIGLICLMLLSGCASAPEETSVELEYNVPEKFAGEATLDTSGPVELNWLESFADPQLEAVIRKTLENNYDLRITATYFDNALWDSKLARSSRLPQFGAGLSGSRRQYNIDNANGSPEDYRDDLFSLTIDASWEADVWGRLRDTEAASLAELQASAADLRYARLSLAAQTAKVWFDVVTSRQQYDLARETVASYERTEDLIRRRYESGISSTLDLRLAQANTANARATLATRLEALQANRRRLQTLMGEYPDAAIRAADGLPDVSGTVSAGLPSGILERRPDIMAAERRLAATQRRVTASRKAFLPQLSLSASGGTSSDELRNVLDPDYLVWTLLGNIAQPIFKGGQLKANWKNAKTNQERAFLQYSNTVLTAFQEVEQALTAEVTSQQNKEALAEAREQSIAAEELAWDQYTSGLVDIITVLESQRRAFDSRIRYLDATNQRLKNRIDLYLALGGDFDTAMAPVADSADPMAEKED